MSTPKSSYDKFLDKWGGVSDAVFSERKITPERKWLYAVLVTYAAGVVSLAAVRAELASYFFLLIPFTAVIFCSLYFENRREHRSKGPAQPRLNSTRQRTFRGLTAQNRSDVSS